MVHSDIGILYYTRLTCSTGLHTYNFTHRVHCPAGITLHPLEAV